MMGDIQLAPTNTWQETLTQLIESCCAELESNYFRVLRDTLFSRRTTLRPNMLRSIASNEVDALNKYFCRQKLSIAFHTYRRSRTVDGFESETKSPRLNREYHV